MKESDCRIDFAHSCILIRPIYTWPQDLAVKVSRIGTLQTENLDLIDFSC